MILSAYNLYFLSRKDLLMSTIYDELNDKLIKFIEKQHMFFVATAPKNGRINLSPKGLDCLKVLSNKKVIYTSLVGSGNETSAHLLQDNRMTMMFCSFDRNPLILRLYGYAKEITPEDDEFDEYYAEMNDMVAVRQLYILEIENVQTSCGFGVPMFDLVADRTTLPDYMSNLGEQGVEDYKQRKNLVTIDGFRTRLKEI